MNEYTIMIVDDAADNLLLLDMMLADRFNIVQANCGQSCLDEIKKSIPDVLLLDVNMPGMNGYEVCTQLRRNSLTKTLPIIFVSAMINTEERLAGFEAGGDEYINKPVEPEELDQKINFYLERLEERKTDQKNANDAMNVAMEAMTSSSELGQIISFVKNSQEANSLASMGRMLCDICLEFGLNAAVLVSGAQPRLFNCEEESIEANILERSLSSNERIINLGIRTIVKSEQVVLLIKNMPIEDEKKYGRFKDHLAVLISISDGRLLTLLTHQKVSQERKGVLKRIITQTEKQIKTLNSKITQHDDKARSTMMEMVTELEQKLFGLGLEEDQEEELMKLVYQTSDKLEGSKEASTLLQDQMGCILEGLYEILEKSD